MDDFNMMPTAMGDVYVEGWGEMVEEHPTRAAVLQALVNLEIRSFTEDGPLPTQAAIAAEVAENGLKTTSGQIKIKFSPTSVKEIGRHINEYLIPEGYVVARPDHGKKPDRRHGGPAAKWRSIIVSDMLKRQFGK